MNFQCDQCGQKYQVADEKLQGRVVTRFRCKKCQHLIDLRAQTDATSSVQAVPSVRPAPVPVPGALSAPSAPRARSATMTAMPIAARVGSVTAVPSRPGASPATPRARSATLVGSSVGATFGVASAHAPRSDPAPAPSTAQLLDALETGWYAGIRDLPVGPLTRKELSARARVGDINHETLVWREGMADWSPLRDVSDLRGFAPAVQLAPPAVLVSNAHAVRSPAAESIIGIDALAPVLLAQLVPLTPPPPRPLSEAPAVRRSLPPPPPPEATARRSMPSPPAAQALALVEPTTEPSAPLSTPPPVVLLAPPVTPPSVPAPAPDELPAVLSVPVAVPSVAPLAGDRSMPAGVWVLSAGLFVVAVAGGIALSGHLGRPAATSVPVPDTVTMPLASIAAAPTQDEHSVPALPEVAADTVLSQPQGTLPEGVATEPAAPSVPTGIATLQVHPLPVHGPRSPGAARPQAPMVSARDLAYLRMQSTTGADLTPSAPLAATPRTPGPTSVEPTPVASPRDFVNRSEAARALDHSGVVHRCWQQLLVRSPATPAQTLHVSIRVGADGQVGSLGSGSGADPSFAACIAAGARSVRVANPSGTAYDTDTSVTLSPGN